MDTVFLVFDEMSYYKDLLAYLVRGKGIKMVVVLLLFIFMFIIYR